MIAVDGTRIVGLVIAGLILVAVIWWLAHAAWATLRERRVGRRRRGVLVAVAGALGGGGSTAAANALRELSLEQRIDILVELAFTVAGVQRTELERLARAAGAMERAERWAHSRRWSRRLRAARVLALFGTGRETIAEDLLVDPRPEVRSQAAEWAGEHPDEARVRRLVVMLGDREPRCRFAAREALVRTGRVAQREIGARLMTAARDPGVELGEQAQAAILGALDVARGIPEPALLAPALELLACPRSAVRTRAVRLASAVGGSEATEALVNLLADPDPEVRAASAAGLGNLGHWQSAASIAALLGDPAWVARRAAGRALIRMGPTGELLLRRATRAGPPSARDIARFSLGLEPGTEPRPGYAGTRQAVA